MYVRAKDAAGFAEFKGSGLPETNGEMTDLFCRYWGGGPGCGFWSFEPRTSVWRRHDIRYSWEMPMPEGMSQKDQDNFKKVIQDLDELAPPDLPQDRASVQRDRPFLYKEFVFQWLFIPELGRWELLPLGRRESVTTAN